MNQRQPSPQQPLACVWTLLGFKLYSCMKYIRLWRKKWISITLSGQFTNSNRHLSDDFKRSLSLVDLVCDHLYFIDTLNCSALPDIVYSFRSIISGSFFASLLTIYPFCHFSYSDVLDWYCSKFSKPSHDMIKNVPGICASSYPKITINNCEEF